MTETPVFEQTKAARKWDERIAELLHALDQPLPHRQPNLLRLNYSINTRWEKQWPFNLLSS